MSLHYSGCVTCDECSRSIRVVWTVTNNSSWESVLPDGAGSLKGWRFAYESEHGDCVVFCPDHAGDAPSDAHVHA